MKQPHTPPRGGWVVASLPVEVTNESLHAVWKSRRIINHQNAKQAVQEQERFLRNNGVKIPRERLRDHATNLWRDKDPDRFPLAMNRAHKVEAGLFDMAFTLAKEFVKAGVALVKGEQVIAGKAEATRRLTICLGCDQFIPDERRCQKCGCFIEYKKLLATADCPLGKW